MEKNIKLKEKINIKKDCQWIIKTILKLKEFIKNIKFNNSLSETMNKIIDIIDLKYDPDINKYINKQKIECIYETTPHFINKGGLFSSTGNNIKTSASSGSKHINNKNLNNNSVEYMRDENKLYRTSKSVENINNNERKINLNFFGIYEKKTVRQKSMECVGKIRKQNLLNDFNNNKIIICNNLENNKIKLDKYSLQNSINETKIFLYKNNQGNKNKIKLNKTQKFINKTAFNNYNKFHNIKISKPEEVINNISFSNKESNKIPKLFRYNNSVDKMDKKRNFNDYSEIFTNRLNNNIFLIDKIDKERNTTSFNYKDHILIKENNYIEENNNTIYEEIRHRRNNSMDNTIKRQIINNYINDNSNINTIDIKYNQTLNNNDNHLPIYKRYIPLETNRTLSSYDSNTSSVISSPSSNNNIFLNESPFINNKNMIKNKTNYNSKLRKNKLYLGLELGNTYCKIGLYNNINNENKTYLKIPTIITFLTNKKDPNKIEIKIGDEASKLSIDNYDQTIFNIIKLFGQNNNDIYGKKELWPFNIYNESDLNKPVIKIKYSNKDYYYNIEDILCIYLKKSFQMFFAQLNINNNNNPKIILNITIGVPNYFNYSQRVLLKRIFTMNLFPKNASKYSKYNIELKKIFIENISNLISFSIFQNYFQQKFSMYNIILSIGGCSTNISLVKLSKDNKNNFIEIKHINSAEFGEEDFLDNLINSCLSQFKEKIRKNCLNSPLILAKIRKALNEVKNKFDKDEIKQADIIINRLFGNIDLKMNININNYYSACIGLFRKIVFLIKETVINSGIDIEHITDIILIGNMSHNYQLKKMMSELFKERNVCIYNKLMNKSIDNEEKNYILKGAMIHCFNKSTSFPKYKITNISPSSIGIENYKEQMEFFIKKGDYIPIQLNKYIKIKKNINNIITINIFEGENKNIRNNKLISSNSVDINNLFNVKKEEKFIEILLQFYMDSNYNLGVYILDKNTYKKQFECLI